MTDTDMSDVFKCAAIRAAMFVYDHLETSTHSTVISFLSAENLLCEQDDLKQLAKSEALLQLVIWEYGIRVLEVGYDTTGIHPCVTIKVERGRDLSSDELEEIERQREKGMEIEKVREKIQRFEEMRKLQEKFRANAQKLRDDPKTKQMMKDAIEMQRAAYESNQMPREEGFARGLINSLIGTFGKGERAEKAKARGMGFLSKWMFEQAMAKGDGKPEEKVEVTPELLTILTKAFNAEMEEHDVPVTAQEEGDSIKISTWDADEKEEH